MDAHGEKSLMAEILLIVGLLLLWLCVAVGGWIGKTYGRYEIKKTSCSSRRS